MSDQLRDRLRDEMAWEPRPPLDGLVTGAVARGATLRRRRRLASGAGTTAVVGAVAAVIALSGQLGTGQGVSLTGTAGAAASTAAAAQQASPSADAPVVTEPVAAATTAAPAVAASAAAPAAAPAPAGGEAAVQARIKTLLAKIKADSLAGRSVTADKMAFAAAEGQVNSGPFRAATALPAGVPATPTGMLQLLTSLLPAGSASHPGVTNDGTRGVESYVSTPSGPAMVRVFLDHQADVPVGCGSETGCSVAANGDIVEVGGLDDNCIQTKFVTVTRPDGSSVMINLSTCLEWNGTENAPSPLAMTIEQATAIAEDPRWDVSMDPALVSAGAAAFPTPHEFG